uniref:Uncharacterized protein n=1 Tax=Bionectria ochroleuca TaxID=29856 RepID=A0A0B7K8J8_BIOOC
MVLGETGVGRTCDLHTSRVFGQYIPTESLRLSQLLPDFPVSSSSCLSVCPLSGVLARANPSSFPLGAGRSFVSISRPVLLTASGENFKENKRA